MVNLTTDNYEKLKTEFKEVVKAGKTINQICNELGLPNKYGTINKLTTKRIFFDYLYKRLQEI